MHPEKDFFIAGKMLSEVTVEEFHIVSVYVNLREFIVLIADAICFFPAGFVQHWGEDTASRQPHISAKQLFPPDWRWPWETSVTGTAVPSYC